MSRTAAHIYPTNMARFIPVRGMRLSDAASYMGMSDSKFLLMVHEGRIAAGFKIDRMTVWDIRDLDIAFDELKGNGLKNMALDNAWGSEVP